MKRLGLLGLVVVVALAAQGRAQAQTAAAVDDVATAPVEIDGIVLFRVRGVTSYSAPLRARAIRDRIIAAADDRAIPVEAIRVVTGQHGVPTIVAGNVPLLPILEADASLEQVSAAELAQAHLVRLRQTVASYRTARSAAALRRSAVNTIIATALLAIAVFATIRFWRWLDGLVRRQLQARIHSVGIQSFEVVRAERIWGALRSTIYGIRTLVFLTSAFVYLGYVLAQWPWTRGLSRDMVGLALAPLQVIGGGIAANIPSLVFLAVLFFVVRLALRVIRLFFEAVERGHVTLSGFDAEWAQPTYKIIRVAIVAFALIVAYPYIPGSESAAFKGVSLFIGIVFSLGSSSAVSNIIAGYMMTYRRAFKVGDRVKIGDAVGDVIEMRLQVTHLRSYKNEEIVIPNSQILAGEVLNYSSLSRNDGLILHTEVGIGYETPWRQVEAMLLTAASRTPGLANERRPFVLLKRLGDFAVTYELNAFCNDVKAMNALYTALHRSILDVFNEYGVQIMTPAYEGDPEVPKVVPPKDWYAAPAAGPTSASEELKVAATPAAARTRSTS